MICAGTHVPQVPNGVLLIEAHFFATIIEADTDLHHWLGMIHIDSMDGFRNGYRAEGNFDLRLTFVLNDSISRTKGLTFLPLC